jgi:hypothetical protein
MIRLSLRAQLGNQMFQYATVRTFAEKQNRTFVWGPPVESFANQLRIALGRMPRPSIHLARYFDLGSDSQWKQLFLRLLWTTGCERNKTIVQPEHEETPEGAFREKQFDLNQIPATGNLELRGWFQSEKYFDENRARVLEWFTLRKNYLRKWHSVEDALNLPAESRCCLHVRRGDYLTSDMGMANGEDGWALPLSYYRNAWQQIPDGITPIIITDDPEYAKEAFQWLPNVVVLKGNSSVVDMWVMKHSRYRIIANSSFSWWASWLSELEDSQTFLPRYFLGWTRQTWVPVNILPSGWISIPVAS